MELADIARLRLRNQRLAGGRLGGGPEVVGWLGAVQAQEYPIAKWSLGLRADDVHDTDVDALLADGSILRTHILRPTWHFVLPVDLRWMMLLTGPRVAAQNRAVRGVVWPDELDYRRAYGLIRAALGGGRAMTRAQLAQLLVDGGMARDRMGAIPFFMRAELDLVLCSGGLAGKSQTYALVDERVPALDHFDRDWALAELTRRYFTSHGPATVTDFSWWSGLTMADTRRGLEVNAASGAALEALDAEGTTYWWAGDTAGSAPDGPSPVVHLLQGYDEYIVAYRSPRTPLNIAGLAPPGALSRPPFLHAVVLDGQLAGWWRRRASADGYVIDSKLLFEFDAAQRAALERAVGRYASFVELPVTLA